MRLNATFDAPSLAPCSIASPCGARRRIQSPSCLGRLWVCGAGASVSAFGASFVSAARLSKCDGKPGRRRPWQVGADHGNGGTTALMRSAIDS